ncbi:hypothetical protein B0H14DRAFT_2605594 [Mycena olivaceomarginata]|nr:hypothetical protein B0H14DRAFT_2605594 [Mycena olivaceomarginata]
MTPIPMPMSESPWLFQGPTERLCRSLAADMKGVATNWVQGIDLDLTLMRSKVTSTLRTFFENTLQERTVLEALLYSFTRKGVISSFNIVAPLYENSPPMPIHEPSLAIELIAFLVARAEQTALNDDPAPSMEPLVERAHRCIVAYGGICHTYPRDHQRG